MRCVEEERWELGAGREWKYIGLGCLGPLSALDFCLRRPTGRRGFPVRNSGIATAAVLK